MHLKLIVCIFAYMEQAILKIKQLRKEKGLSQFDVANRLGISQTAYASIESGKTKSISIQIGKGLAEVFDQDFNELFSVERKDNDQSHLIQELQKEIKALKEQIEDKKTLISFFQKEKSAMKYIILSWYLQKYELKHLNVLLNKDNRHLNRDEIEEKVFELKQRASSFLSIFMKNGLIDEDDMNDYFRDISKRVRIEDKSEYSRDPGDDFLM